MYNYVEKERFFMELIIEIILELFIEGGEEICTNRKISKWIRYPILFLLILFFLAVMFLIFFVGISALRTNMPFGILIIAIGLVMLISFINKFRKVYLRKKN